MAFLNSAHTAEEKRTELIEQIKQEKEGTDEQIHQLHHKIEQLSHELQEKDQALKERLNKELTESEDSVKSKRLYLRLCG